MTHAGVLQVPSTKGRCARGVAVTTSPGANAGVVVQTALAGVLMLARCSPQLLEA